MISERGGSDTVSRRNLGASQTRIGLGEVVTRGEVVISATKVVAISLKQRLYQ